MHIHIKRKHIGRNPELALKIGSRSFPNSVAQLFYAYKTLNHSGKFADEIKNTEANFDKHLENIRRINEANRSINEFRQNSTANSSFSPEIAKSLIIQTTSNLFQGRHSGSSMTPKKEILPTGYQISFCDTCLSGCNLRP